MSTKASIITTFPFYFLLRYVVITYPNYIFRTEAYRLKLIRLNFKYINVFRPYIIKLFSFRQNGDFSFMALHRSIKNVVMDQGVNW